MNILFLDTASKNHALALCTETELLNCTRLPEKGDAKLVPAIERALKEANLEYENLTNLACVIGPGGFTSLRIGVTAVNTLAYSLGMPSVGIHLSDLWSGRVKQGQSLDSAAAASPLEKSHNFLWLHSTRRTQIFVRGFGADGTITPIGTFDLDDAAKLKGSYVGELIPEHQKLLKECHPIPESDLASLEEFLPAFLGKQHYAVQALAPWYGREAT